MAINCHLYSKIKVRVPEKEKVKREKWKVETQSGTGNNIHKRESGIFVSDFVIWLLHSIHIKDTCASLLGALSSCAIGICIVQEELITHEKQRLNHEMPGQSLAKTYRKHIRKQNILKYWYKET